MNRIIMLPPGRKVGLQTKPRLPTPPLKNTTTGFIAGGFEIYAGRKP